MTYQKLNNTNDTKHVKEETNTYDYKKTPKDNEKSYDSSRDVTFVEILKIACLPFIALGVGLDELRKMTYRSVRECFYKREYMNIIREHTSRNMTPIFYKGHFLHYIYWKDGNKCYIIHMRPLFQMKYSENIENIIIDLYEKEPCHFIVSHVNTLKEITSDYIKNLESIRISDVRLYKYSIVVADYHYEDIWSRNITFGGKSILITDIFHVDQYHKKKWEE